MKQSVTISLKSLKCIHNMLKLFLVSREQFCWTLDEESKHLSKFNRDSDQICDFWTIDLDIVVWLPINLSLPICPICLKSNCILPTKEYKRVSLIIIDRDILQQVNAQIIISSSKSLHGCLYICKPKALVVLTSTAKRNHCNCLILVTRLHTKRYQCNDSFRTINQDSQYVHW